MFPTLALTLVLAATAAEAVVYAPIDRPGPALSVPHAELTASLECTPDLHLSPRATVLLVHATTVTPEENWGWNYVPWLESMGWPHCTVRLPNRAMSDIQVSGEYVVHAIREIFAESGRRLQILGHSQGGQLPRWALRFWPDTRAMVDDLIAFAPTNHGSVIVDSMCSEDCAPSIWQQTFESNYVLAMNSYQETFPEISYTVVYTHHDEFVQPNLDDSGTSSLSGGMNVRNVATQDVCPTNDADHLFIGTSDPVGFALAFDALSHMGPADPSRLPLTVCAEVFMPGVDPLTFPTDAATATASIFDQLSNYPHVPEEPPLAAYTLPEAPWSLGLIAGGVGVWRLALRRRCYASRR